MQRDYWYSLSRRWQELESAVDIGVKAAENRATSVAPESPHRQIPGCFGAKSSGRIDRAFERRYKRWIAIS